MEAIIAPKKQGRGLKYLVKWKDYPSSENSWEPGTNLKHSQEILNRYRKRHSL
ncbi:chromo domain-containing protein [Alkalibacillus haloalkaliphilus]|uniref:chromo domain-containing protein n=1 Tax=Alkalibacillus haloalkaliphilus TaxID=94136 RepID=UPI0034E0425B